MKAITVYRRAMDEGEGEINKIRFDILEDHYDHFWPCLIYIFIYLRLPARKLRPRVMMTLGQNSVMSQVK